MLLKNIFSLLLLPFWCIFSELYAIVNYLNYLFYVLFKKRLDSKYFSRLLQKNVKIVGVGNITFGASGKTPFVLFLAKYYLLKGYFVVVITKKYDEYLIFTDLKHKDFRVILAHHKGKAILNFISKNKDFLLSLNMDIVFIVDDAMQHYSLLYDKMLVVHNVFSGLCFRREFLIGFLRADVVFFTKSNFLKGIKRNFYGAISWILKKIYKIPVFYIPSRVFVSPLSPISSNDLKEVLKKQYKIYILCALGDYKFFIKSVFQYFFNMGFSKETIFYDVKCFFDHYEFKKRDFEFLHGDKLFCAVSVKDYVKIRTLLDKDLLKKIIVFDYEHDIMVDENVLNFKKD